jgi:hypothetical protein
MSTLLSQPAQPVTNLDTAAAPNYAAPVTASTPGSGAALVGRLGTAGGAAEAAGGAISAISSIFTGIYGSDAANNRALQYRQQSTLDLFNAGAQVTQTQNRAVATMKAAAAAAGGAGVTGTGSPALAQAETINRANTQDAYDRYAGRLRSVSDLYQAQLASYEGKQSIFGGFVGAGMEGASTAAILSGL